MAAYRVLVVLVLVACVVCFGTYAFTGDVRWRRRGLVVAKWAVVVALGFFAVLIAERLIEP